MVAPLPPPVPIRDESEANRAAMKIRHTTVTDSVVAVIARRRRRKDGPHVIILAGIGVGSGSNSNMRRMLAVILHGFAN